MAAEDMHKKMKYSEDVTNCIVTGDVIQNNSIEGPEPTGDRKHGGRMDKERDLPLTPQQREGMAKPDRERCQFYLKKKNRFCKTRPDHDGKYCVQHAYDIMGNDVQEANAAVKRRIPCPLDPNHTVYETKMTSHLKKCNVTKQKQQVPPYFVENINLPRMCPADAQTHKVSIRDIPDSEVLQLVEIVRKLHSEHIKCLETEVLFHDVLKEQGEKPSNGPAAQKHIQQQASLVSHIENAGLLTDNSTYVEFGAGKGGLSHWVQLALREASNTQYVLVDKGSARYKMDNFHKGENQGPTFQRIKMDIQHLQLGKVESIRNDSRHLVGLGKHLCGGATDLMLRCLMEPSLREGNNIVNPGQSRVAGLVLALCCHHRCDWGMYVGKEFFHSCALTEREFYLICSMTSWATCGAPQVSAQAMADHQQMADHTQEMVSSSHDVANHTQKLVSSSHDVANHTQQMVSSSHDVADHTQEMGNHSTQDVAHSVTETASDLKPLPSANRNINCTPAESIGPQKSGTYNHPRYGDLSPAVREEIGRQCKQLLDKGRQVYLTSMGYSARVLCYIEKQHTLENMALIATQDKVNSTEGTSHVINQC